MFERRVVVALAVALCVFALPLAAEEPVFRDLTLKSLQNLPPRGGDREIPLPARFRALEVNVKALESLLDRAPAEGSAVAVAAPTLLTLPYPDGTDRLFRIEESPILAPELAARFPEIRTFVAQGIDDPTATARLSLTPLGFHAMVLSASGTVFVDPYRRWNPGYVLSYFKSDARKAAKSTFRCDVRDELLAGGHASDLLPDPQVITAKAAAGSQLRTYRLAVAGTGEYTTAVCAPNPAAVACALDAMAVSMNRVDGDLRARGRDPDGDDRPTTTWSSTPTAPPIRTPTATAAPCWERTRPTSTASSARPTTTSVTSSRPAGEASPNCRCRAPANKARGVTGQPNPVGDGFDVDYVAHEMGHQFGGAHTFNGTTSKCGGGNRSASSAYEPGSGITIMAYAGICGAEDLQPHSDDTFHTRSFDQIVAFSTGATGSSCAGHSPRPATPPPTVNAGAAFTIPKQTPFTLTGSATDPDGDALTYMWEEFDLGSAAPPNDRRRRGAADLPLVRAADRAEPHLPPPPGHPRQRRDPRRVDVDRNRTMTFRLTARDNRAGGGGVNYASTTVTVVTAAGPFAVTQPEHGGDLGRRQRADGDLERGGDRPRAGELRQCRDRLSRPTAATPSRPPSWPRRPTTARSP